MLNPRTPALRPNFAQLQLEATFDLLTLIKGGDQTALERLLGRCIPALTRIAHGRMPRSARGMLETADLVQDAMIKALPRLDAFESRHQGALLAYLREAVLNRVRDIARHDARRPEQTDVPDHLRDRGPSPFEELVKVKNAARYDAALQRLKPPDREAIICRLELQYSYDELAVALGKPSVAAARMAVARAVRRLAAELGPAS